MSIPWTTPFPRKRDGVHLHLGEAERRLLSGLLAQVVELVESGDVADPALARLLPDAYSDDAEATAEFRRLTSDDLAEAKAATARTVIASLGSDRREPLGAEGEMAWLRSLTDLRLTLGTRLGVTADGAAPGAEPQTVMVFDWLGYLQEALVRALDR